MATGAWPSIARRRYLHLRHSGISDQTPPADHRQTRAAVEHHRHPVSAHTGCEQKRPIGAWATDPSPWCCRVDVTTTTCHGQGAMRPCAERRLTAAGAWPSAARYLYKAASSTPVGWAVIGDARAVYVWTNSGNYWARQACSSAMPCHHKAGDTYHALLIAATASSAYGANLGGWDRSPARTGAAIWRKRRHAGAARYSHAKSGNYLGVCG